MPNAALRICLAGAGLLAAVGTSACREARSAPVAALAVTPVEDTLLVGGTARLVARVRDSAGRQLSHRRITWSTSDRAVARPSSDGLVTAVGPGVATVTATSEGRTASARISVSSAAGELQDVPYCGPDPLRKMDVYVPTARHPRPLPGAVFIHGGSWVSGDKRTGGWRFTVVRDSLLARGYVVASLNYRLGPGARWPAQIQDVKCAIRALRATSLTYGLDPTRIVVWGTSAGGHLAALLGTTDRDVESQGTDEYSEYSSRASGVVDIAGPTDLSRPGELHLDDLKAVFSTLPDSASSELVGASPVHQVTAHAAPFYVVHGDRDAVVQLEQAVRLYGRLGEAAVPRQMLVVLNANHSIAPAGGPIVPDRASIVRSIVDFIERCTRRSPARGHIQQ